MKILDAKAVLDEERKNLDTILAWNLIQVQRENKKVHFATLMDTCHLSKIRSWDQKVQKYKGRVVVSGDIVEDDSGAYAVFFEQGSFASQIDWLQKSWTSLQDYQVVMDKQLTKYVLYPGKIVKMLPDCSKFRNRNVLMFGYAFHNTNGKNHCEKVKIL